MWEDTSNGIVFRSGGPRLRFSRHESGELEICMENGDERYFVYAEPLLLIECVRRLFPEQGVAA